MFGLFPETTINKQVRLYIEWKAIRHPATADSHEWVLKDFFKQNRKVRCATEISAETLRSYIESRNGEFAKKQAEKCLRGFFLYWMKMGVLTRNFDSTVNGDILPPMLSVSPRMNVENVRLVQQLRKTGKDGNPMTFMQIKYHLETKDKRRYDIAQIHRWSKYVLPELSPQSPKVH